MRKNISHSEKETKKIASEIVRSMKGGEVIGLKGELGVGKTVFVKGVLEYFQYRGVVQSPTFVIRKDYIISAVAIKKIIHIDLYRLTTVQKGDDEFLDDVGEADTLTFIEWPGRLGKTITQPKIFIDFTFGKNDIRVLSFRQ